MICLEKARWRLAATWFPAAALLLLLLVGQSIMGVYGGSLQRVWSWALPNFLPTLALMVSVFAAEALNPNDSGTVFVRRNFCTLSLGLSVFYLVLLLLTILIPPLLPATDGPVDRIKILENSNLWLGPVQGLVVMALGVLFFTKDRGGTSTGEDG